LAIVSALRADGKSRPAAKIFGKFPQTNSIFSLRSVWDEVGKTMIYQIFEWRAAPGDDDNYIYAIAL